MSMIQIEKPQVEALLGKILALNELFQQNSDPENAQRAIQLSRKLNNNEYTIAFCGHFSAGKSTMINQFVGGDMLPSSPIPTSANLVRIKAGEEYAKVYFKKEKPRLYLAPYDYEKVKSYCRNGDEIQSVEISYKNTKLPENVVILDTPGIDSTDEAHRVATESALHLADLVLYVMDYNHVQSEVNFMFAKELTQAGKEFWLVINQVDKHREEEISFAEFKHSVKQSFASWGVNPNHIFYTSLKNLQHPSNQLSALHHEVNLKIEDRYHALPTTIHQSLIKLTKDHLKNVIEKDQVEMKKLENILNELPPEESSAITVSLETIHVKRKELQLEVSKAEQEFNDETTKLLNNAYLMPYQTRELAEQYLQACQPGFKIGVLFSKSKTEQARKERLERFFNDLSEKVKSQLEWHLREYLIKTIKEKGIYLSPLIQTAQSFSVILSKGLIEQSVKQGARLSGDYVLTYTNDVVNAIKGIVKRKLLDIKEILLQELAKQNLVKLEQLEGKINSLQTYLEAMERYRRIVDYHEEITRNTAHILNDRFDLNRILQNMSIVLGSETVEVEVVRNTQPIRLSKSNKAASYLSSETALSNENKPYTNDHQDQLVKQLRFTAEKIRFLPELEKVAVELGKRAEKLENKQFTVALFGAFSAGKSSFANALLGGNVLPVSPNPTTAAINSIKPIDQNHPHGTLIIKLKSNTNLLDEIGRSLKVFNAKATSLKDAIQVIEKMIGIDENFDPHKKFHFAFLQAFYKGFSQIEERIGQTFLADLKEFHDFVAKEERSCFVESIDLYFDCSLTRQGITLVDTPGADSIHARHTDVAFNYIKSADAILFVTYYNHAFSKADREFLIQLGRVKDTFDLDKMFFIINAIDLANNKDELDMVIEYVKDQLQSYGIRKPNMFAVSSLLALQEKIKDSSLNHSRMKQFEESFYHFINHDLMEIVLSSAKKELNRANQLVEQLIASSQEDQLGKENRRVQTLNEQDKIISMIKEQTYGIINKRLQQEADELLFYIKQRVLYRLHDFFKESFSPTVLIADGRNMNAALQSALEEFMDSLSFDFLQEMRATTLRIEAFISKLTREQFEILTSVVKSEQSALSFSPYEAKKIEGLPINQPFQTIDKKIFRTAFSYYKNPKSFFERNEKKLMLEELIHVLQDPSNEYVRAEGERIKTYYLQVLETLTSEMQTNLIEQITDYYHGILSALRVDFPIEELIQVHKELKKFSRNEC
jgi:small GTP-binding protein